MSGRVPLITGVQIHMYLGLRRVGCDELQAQRSALSPLASH